MDKKATWIAVTTIILGGTSILSATFTNSRMDTMNETLSSPEQAMNSEMQNVISAEKAEQIASQAFDGQIEQLELKSNHEAVFYEIAINDHQAKYEIYIDPYTGEVLKADKGDGINEENSVFVSIVSVEQAKQIALGQAGDGELLDLTLEKSEDGYAYKINLKTKENKVKVTIDAVTGEVVVIEIG